MDKAEIVVKQTGHGTKTEGKRVVGETRNGGSEP